MYLKTSSQENNPETQPGLSSLTLSEPEKLVLFEDILNDGISLRVKVTGRSMAPFLRGGELLTIKKADASSLRKGDLIFFKNQYGSPIIHRIIKTSRGPTAVNTFQTKGDALMVFDEPVCEDKILGKVCLIERIGPHGELKSIDMESLIRRNLNYFLALKNFFKTKLYFSARRIYRLLPS